MQISVWAVIALALAAVAALCFACGAGVLAARSRRRLRMLDPQEREVYVSYEQPDYSASAGFSLENLPRTGILAPQAYWLVGGCIAEVEYSVAPDQRAWLRLARHGHLCCADAHRDLHYDSTQEYGIDGVRVLQQQITGGFVKLSWSRGGYDYMLYAPQPQMGALNGAVAAFVRELTVREAAE